EDPPPAHVRTLSLHDALPIYTWAAAKNGMLRPGRGRLFRKTHRAGGAQGGGLGQAAQVGGASARRPPGRPDRPSQSRRLLRGLRSEEHTSELQSRENLVCRLL